MLNSLVLASAFMAAPATQPAPAQPVIVAVPGRQLKDLPNTTIQYYDVAGKNLKAVNESITEAQQRRDASGKTIVTTSRWAVDAKFSKRTQNGVCKVDSATAAFTATAMMPRLATEQKLKPAEQVVWRDYLAAADATQAATLWFAHDHAGDIEKAVLASNCEGAQAAGSAAVERLRLQVAEFQKTYAAAHAAAPAPAAPKAKPAS
jgi:predicted secreted Zn-dependent protease